MSQPITGVSDLIAERKKNLERNTKVKNISKKNSFCSIGPGMCGVVTPMQQFQHRAWLKKIKVESSKPKEGADV